MSLTKEYLATRQEFNQVEEDEPPMPISKYSFEEKGHRHLWDGKRMTGVTTVLSVIAKPALISWAANMAVDYIESCVVQGHYNMRTKEGSIEFNKAFKDLCAEARKAHTKKKEAAGDIGKTVHAAVEEFIKHGTEPQLDEQGMKMFENFRKWAVDNKVKFLESEKHLYSESLFLGGILDMVVEIDGQNWICDVKTGGVYAEAFYQMAAYQMLWEEMKLPGVITGHIILGLKKDGTFEEKRSISNEENKEAFMAAYKLYKITQKVNSQIL